MKRIRTRFQRSAIGAWCVVAVGLVGAQSSTPGKPVAPDAPKAASASVLIPSGAPPDLFLLYTGDVIGYLDPCG